MDPFMLMSLQSTLSLIAFAFIANWYIAPRLAKRDKHDALCLLAWVHVFRYTPLTLFAPGQVDAGVPEAVRMTIGHGDLVSGLLALVAVFALRNRWGIAIGLTWLLNIVGIADVIVAMYTGISNELYLYDLGFNWYILNYYVPLLIVTHVMMIQRLLKKDQA